MKILHLVKDFHDTCLNFVLDLPCLEHLLCSYMSKDFDWIYDQEIQSEVQPNRNKRPRIGRYWFVGVTVILVLAGAWAIGRWQLARLERDTRQEVQVALDLLGRAATSNDNELFLSLQAADPAWQASLLQPELRTLYYSSPQVSRAEPYEDDIWANVIWNEDGRQQQRILFFRRDEGAQLLQIPPPADYWGTAQRSRHEWGELILHEVDQRWRDEIATYLDQFVATQCADGACVAGQPLTVEIRADYRQSAAPNLLYVPSPRLLSLESDGRPAPLFWQRLRQGVESRLLPVTIRFAVPPFLQQAVDYRAAAAEFMAQYPQITVEVVELTLPPEEADESLADYDGAAYLPTEAMLQAGLVADVTDLAESDADFDQSDFYEQVWQGAIWRERLWAMPLAGQMRLLYYDRQAYRDAFRSAPAMQWTWDRLERDLRALQSRANLIPPTQDASWSGEYALLDPTRDLLYAYAYSTHPDCPDVVTVYCVEEIGTAEADAALAWYGRLVNAGQMSPSAGSTLKTRNHLIANWQSFRRRAAIWVDEPVRYEHHLLIGGVGLAPFPGSTQFNGITPLWVHGGFISGNSPNRQAVWQWLTFLSHQPLNATLRYVPARPSVATETRFWEVLPRPLGNVLRAAFPFARPVLISEQGLIDEEGLSAVEDNQ